LKDIEITKLKKQKNMAANDCLTLDSDTHPADVLEWLAKILEPGHYCQSRDADGKLVLNVEFTVPDLTSVKITKFIVHLEQLYIGNNFKIDFRLHGSGIILAFFEFNSHLTANADSEQLIRGLLVDESFADLLQDKLGTWEAGAFCILGDRSLFFTNNLKGTSSRLTPIVAPGSTVKSSGKV
jgi:hypothetical protein